MAGYQTFEALRPILHKGPPATPVLDRMLFYKPYRKGSPTLAQLKEMRAFRAQGCSLREIADRFGFWIGTAHRYVRDVPLPVGYSAHKPSRFTDAQRSKAARMRRAGFTWDEIGEDLGCGKTEAKRMVAGDERDRTREIRTPANEILHAVHRVTEIPRREIREARRIGARDGSLAIRARQMVFWICVRRAGLSQSKAGKSLGFDHKTVAHALALVDEVAKRLTFTDRMGSRRVARLLWEAEWPKASA